MAHSSSSYASAGGFFPPSASLPSPAPSTASSRAAAGLPQPRSKPLAPGSRKEDYARNYVSARLLHVSRRYVKHFGLPEAGDDTATAGYSSFAELCADLDDVVGVLWFSGTPTLQVPYLLSVALAVREYAPAFAPAPRPTFALLRKLDHCFASLLAGRDARSGAPLPGFEHGNTAKGMTKTDMVRCKSLAEETRSLIAVLMSGEADVENYAPEEDDDDNKTKEDQSAPSLARPGKRRRDEAEEAATPVGLGRDVDDDDDDDDDDTEEDVRTENSSPKRRRSDTPPRRPHAPYIKAEETEAEEASLAALRSPHPGGGAPEAEAESGIGHAPAAAAPSATGQPQQFHWALEDDDLTDDDDEVPTSRAPPPFNTSNPAAADASIPVPTPSAGLPQTPPTPLPGAVDADMVDAGAEDEDEDDEGDGGQEEDEEEGEEELHMNVAKVYEKTLVQLGRVLGESLVDD